jgi:hypothetical protein
LPRISSSPIINEDKEINAFIYYIELKWASINCMIFDYVTKRKLKKLIIENNYREMFSTIVNYENISGRTRHTENIKNFAIYNIINNDFTNSKILERI